VIEVRISFLIKALWVGIIISLVLFGGCTKKKTTAPNEPAKYLMIDYFPLNVYDEWIWDVIAHDSIQEPFFDGDLSLGEPYVDIDSNGRYDFGEPFEDLNLNGKYDGPNDPWTSGIPYEDLNHDGQYDLPNGVWDAGESFADLDGNMICNKTINLTIGVQVQYALNHLKHCKGGYYITMVNDNPYWFVLFLCEDAFSNDTLGLRWHGHVDPTHWKDYLKEVKPITIANASTRIGDTVSYEDTSVTNIYTWISIFEGVEDVIVPGGTFQDCLKFKTLASGWIGNMQKYNGTSYQWYAKDVGLVKSEGTGQGEHWLLKSAKISGKDYP
jgi:hypothetical protein